MQSTKESYLLTRNVMRVEIRKNKLLQFIKIHKVFIIISAIFLGLITIEGMLINQFIKLLSFI